MIANQVQDFKEKISKINNNDNSSHEQGHRSWGGGKKGHVCTSPKTFSHFKGTLMQIRKSPYMFVFMQK